LLIITLVFDALLFCW